MRRPLTLAVAVLAALDGAAALAQQPADCSYWSGKAAEARQNAQKNRAEAQRSDRDLRLQAARALDNAAIQYQQKFQECQRQRSGPQYAAPGAGRGRGKASKGGNDPIDGSNLPKVIDFDAPSAEQKQKADDQIQKLQGTQERLEGIDYKGTGGDKKLPNALDRVSTDDLAPDGTDTWNTAPPAGAGGPPPTPVDPTGLPDVIDFNPGDPPAPCDGVRVICFGEPAPAAPPAPATAPRQGSHDYAETGVTTPQDIGNALANNLFQPPPGPEQAVNVAGLALDPPKPSGGPANDGRLDEPATTRPSSARGTEEVAERAAKRVISDRTSDVVDAVDTSYDANKARVIDAARSKGREMEIREAFAKPEGAMACLDQQGVGCERTMAEYSLRNLPYIGALYRAKDRVEETVRDVHQTARDLDTVLTEAVSGMWDLGQKTSALIRVSADYARVKVQQQLGRECRRRRNGEIACAAPP